MPFGVQEADSVVDALHLFLLKHGHLSREMSSRGFTCVSVWRIHPDNTEETYLGVFNVAPVRPYTFYKVG